MGHQWTIGAFDTFFCHLSVIFQVKKRSSKREFPVWQNPRNHILCDRLSLFLINLRHFNIAMDNCPFIVESAIMNGGMVSFQFAMFSWGWTFNKTMALCCWFYHDSSLAQLSSQPRKKKTRGRTACTKASPYSTKGPTLVHTSRLTRSHIHTSTRPHVHMLYYILYTIIYYILYTMYYIIIYHTLYTIY